MRKQSPERLIDLPKVAQRVSGKGQLRTLSPGVPSPAPSSTNSLSLPSRAWAEPGLWPREPWRPGELLQRAQAGSYSQAETCRILLCTTRQQHPCAGTDRNKAQGGKAQGGHCVSASPLLEFGFDSELHFPSWPRSVLEGQSIKGYMLLLPGIHSFIHSTTMPTAPNMPGSASLGGDKTPVLKFSLTQETDMYVYIKQCDINSTNICCVPMMWQALIRLHLKSRENVENTGEASWKRWHVGYILKTEEFSLSS